MGGAPALPTPNTPEYTVYVDAYGKKWTACDCLAEWLGWLEKVFKARGLIKSNIDIWQLTGAAAASAGTHSKGGVFDLLYQTTDAHVAVAREMGAPATWRRVVTPTSTWRREHIHGVLTGCPHNSPAAYQITAQKAGYNGLGTNGRAGVDPHPDPKVYRTWQQGIEWAKAEIARLTPPEPAQLKPVATSLASDRPAVTQGETLTLTATVSPAIAGVVVFDWLNGDEWVRFARVPVAASSGRATVTNRPSKSVTYRTGFDAKDNTVYRDGNYSKTLSVPVVDLAKVLSDQVALQHRVEQLEADQAMP